MNIVPMAHPVHQKRAKHGDIRETELYQENYPGERVFEGGALAGMPLDRLNRPLVGGVTQVAAPQMISQPTIISQAAPIST